VLLPTVSLTNVANENDPLGSVYTGENAVDIMAVTVNGNFEKDRKFPYEISSLTILNPAKKFYSIRPRTRRI
jgi:hypothetical protein